MYKMKMVVVVLVVAVGLLAYLLNPTVGGVPSDDYVFIDIDSYANTINHFNPAGNGGSDDDWSWVPQGEQTYLGVPFYIGKEHICMHSTYNNKGLKNVLIPVNKIKGKSLFAIVGTGWGYPCTGFGDCSCDLIIHYTDGTSDSFCLDGKYMDDFNLPHHDSKTDLAKEAVSNGDDHLDIISFDLKPKPVAKIEIIDSDSQAYSIFMAFTIKREVIPTPTPTVTPSPGELGSSFDNPITIYKEGTVRDKTS